MTCEKCRWYKSGKSSFSKGACYLNPPTAVPSPGGFNSVRPEVCPDDFCASFEEAT